MHNSSVANQCGLLHIGRTGTSANKNNLQTKTIDMMPHTVATKIIGMSKKEPIIPLFKSLRPKKSICNGHRKLE